MLSMSHAMVVMAAKNPKILLVVDNEPQITRLVRRVCTKDFAIVYTACSAKRATQILNSIPVTHLVCDFNLNEDQNGVALICGWRSQFSSLQRTILYTGSDFSQISTPDQIDVVLQKGESTSLLRSAVLGKTAHSEKKGQ